MAQHVTFWKMKVQPGKIDDLRGVMSSQADEGRLRGRGWQMSIVGTRKDNPEEVWGCVTWDTSDRYYQNAESPEQGQMFEKMRAMLASDPEWFDCDVVEERKA
jgi:hypothetical protein